MTENEKLIKSYADAIDCLKKNKPTSGYYMLQESVDMAIKALEEVQQYRQIGTVEECLKNKDFLDFLSDKMNPNDFETYLRLYNALEEKGCDADGKN
mgnify:CR=1 FL=1